MAEERPPNRRTLTLTGEKEERVSKQRSRTISGLSAVGALFKQRPDSVQRLFYDEKLIPQLGPWCALMAKNRRPYRMVPQEELAKISGTVLHGGIVAVADPLEVQNFNRETPRLLSTHAPVLFVLDGIGNPQNLGAIARTLAFYGHRYLGISDHPQQTGLSDAAYRIAEGGLEYLSLIRFPRLRETLSSLKPDFKIIGTTLGHQGLPPEAFQDEEKNRIILLGNEESGLPEATLRICDALITLQGTGSIQSLNVSATAAILAHGFTKKSPLKKTERARVHHRRDNKKS